MAEPHSYEVYETAGLSLILWRLRDGECPAMNCYFVTQPPSARADTGAVLGRLISTIALTLSLLFIQN